MCDHLQYLYEHTDVFHFKKMRFKTSLLQQAIVENELILHSEAQTSQLRSGRTARLEGCKQHMMCPLVIEMLQDGFVNFVHNQASYLPISSLCARLPVGG